MESRVVATLREPDARKMRLLATTVERFHRRVVASAPPKAFEIAFEPLAQLLLSLKHLARRPA